MNIETITNCAEQHHLMLQMFLGSISQDQPMAILPSEYDLVLKSEVSA